MKQILMSLVLAVAMMIPQLTLAAAPAVDNAAGATNILSISADLEGTLTSTGGVPTEVYVYWGGVDGGTTFGNWANTNYLGTNDVGALNLGATNLVPNSTYYYRYYATNADGEAWSATTTNFQTLFSAGPTQVNLGTTAHFTILSGALISGGPGTITGDVGASPIAGSAIGLNAVQVSGIIYAVDASGPAGSVVAPVLLTTAKGDLTIAYNYARDLTPVPTGTFLNPGAAYLGGYNIGGLTLVPGLYKFGAGQTAYIAGSDVTLMGGPNDVWIFQCGADLQVGVGMKVILAGGALARNVFWQVGTSAALDVSSVFKGTIMADQSITMGTSSTLEGRALARIASVTFAGSSADLPAPDPSSLLLTVVSSYGTPNPDVGVYTNAFGAVLTNSVNSIDSNGTTQYVSAGWIMSGNLPGSGTSNSFIMTQTNYATLVWLWKTNYWLDATADPNGSLNVTSAWYTAGSNVTITATPTVPYYFTEWTGTGITVSNRLNNPLTISMTQPQGVMANFSGLSDFEITNITIDAPSPVVGDYFTVYVTVHNRGATGNAGYLYVYTNAPSTVVAGTAGTRAVYVGPMAAGTSRTLTMGMFAPEIEGTNVFRAFIDARNVTLESDEVNNQLALSYSVVTRADLMITSITFDPVQASTNADFAATVVIKNRGTRAATNVHVSVWLNMPEMATDNTGENASNDIAAIGVGQSLTNVFAGLPGGASLTTRVFRVFADSKLAVVELQEYNNQLAKAYITKAHPDFSITDITLDPVNPLYGKIFTAYVTVTNTGAVAGNAGYLYVYTNKPVAVAAKTIGNGSAYVGTLLAGKGKRLAIANLKAGIDAAKTFRAFIDASALTIEVSETNNQRTLSYSVITKPDLRVTGIALTPSRPSRGGVFDATVTVKNQGSAPAASVMVSVWVNMSAVAVTNIGFNQEAAVGPIASNASVVHTFTGLDAGVGTVGRVFRAFADSDLSIAEIDENNNQLTLAYTPASRPDFKITVLTLSTTNPPAGSNFVANVTVKNTGYVAGNAGYLDVWLNKGTNVVPGPTLMGNSHQYVGALNTNATKLFTFTGFRALGFAGMSKVFRAVVDSRGYTIEVVETNNQETVDYTIAP